MVPKALPPDHFRNPTCVSKMRCYVSIWRMQIAGRGMKDFLDPSNNSPGSPFKCFFRACFAGFGSVDWVACGPRAFRPVAAPCWVTKLETILGGRRAEPNCGGLKHCWIARCYSGATEGCSIEGV